MIEGFLKLPSTRRFCVHTFRLVNKEGQSYFVKFHWKPKQGLESLVWDEAQILHGKDIDFHRKDLYESIDKGDYPEWELGLQIIKPEQEFDFDFDILDPTKLWPEDQVPVKIVGKMTLNRNVDNVFAETEQVAFHPAHIVPGIDFSNDPLLQGRLFSYTDTQIFVLADQTLTKFLLTAQLQTFIIINAMQCINHIFIKVKQPTIKWLEQ